MRSMSVVFPTPGRPVIATRPLIAMGRDSTLFLVSEAGYALQSFDRARRVAV